MIEYFSKVSIDSEGSMNGRMPLSSRDRWLMRTLNNIIFRCTNPKDKRFKNYGGRGIKTFLTLEDLQFLYERDRPDLMRRPSIDRIENEGNYERDNCRFLEIVDNVKRSKRRPYACDKCGVVGLPKYFRDKKLCPTCSTNLRIASIVYPAYVQFAIEQATQYGFEVKGRLDGQGYSGRVTQIEINGLLAKVHYAAVYSVTGSSHKYWRFGLHEDVPFSILVAKRNKVFHCWIFPGKPKRPCLYIPIGQRQLRGRPPLYIWPSLKDAWHLFGASTQNAIEAQAVKS